MSDDPLPDHPEVRMPPPLLHLGGLLIGYGLVVGLSGTGDRSGGSRGALRLYL